MKREWMTILIVLSVMLTMLIPVSAAMTAVADMTPTTTMPYTTTTTDWNCCSTDTTWPPTTTTTWVLTGPDGTAPTTMLPTTTTPPPQSVCGDVNDLLQFSRFTTSDTMAILADPYYGGWLSADCYSYDGGTLTIEPYAAELNAAYDYMHLTIIANVPFTVSMTTDWGNLFDPMTWFPESAIQTDGTIAAGAYVLAGDVSSPWDGLNPIEQFTVTLTAPGSVTVGHLVLSHEAVCHEEAPKIQTTTRPSFPWDDTTTAAYDTTTWTTTTLPTTTTTWVLTGPDGTNPDYNTTVPTTIYTTVTTTTVSPVTSTTSPTTNPTVNDALVPGDADFDGIVTSSDARTILMYCLTNVELGFPDSVLADFNGDGAVTTTDVRELLLTLIL
ncbi:MAG: dockerin type I repeat-containing protein [Clostridia bacterium]|nr:dockerin type I repeat-containing protein [Clostridia bacterium]